VKIGVVEGSEQWHQLLSDLQQRLGKMKHKADDDDRKVWDDMIRRIDELQKAPA